MMLLSLLAIATTAVFAAPLEPQPKTFSVPLKQRSNVKSLKNLVLKGHSRINLITGAQTGLVSRQTGSGQVTNEEITYVAEVTMGGTKFELVVDNGSSNTWCGNRVGYKVSATGKATGGTCSLSYGSGAMSGSEYIDEVTFGELTVKAQMFGVADSVVGFPEYVDGILGFGPVGLTMNSVSNVELVPTFTNNLAKEGTIASEILAVSFKPISGLDSTSEANGELTIGGTNDSKYSGALSYFPTLREGTASKYWGITIDGFSFDGTPVGSSTAAIVDTGTTLIYIPDDAHEAFLTASGGTADTNTGLPSWTTKPTGDFGITIGGTTFKLTPEQYLVPENQYKYFDLTTGTYYAWISQSAAVDVGAVVGQKFLEHYYSVYDTDNASIGFAPAV